MRTFRPEDAGPLLQELREPSIRRWTPTFAWPTPEEATHRVEQAIEAAEQGQPTSFVITTPIQPEQMLGTIDFRSNYPQPPFSIRDVGYAVSPAARGRGVGSTALRLLSRWLLDPEGGDVHRVQLDHAVENIGSCRTALRADFAIEGLRRKYLPLKADPTAPVVRHDVCLHGLTRAY